MGRGKEHGHCACGHRYRHSRRAIDPADFEDENGALTTPVRNAIARSNAVREVGAQDPLNAYPGLAAHQALTENA